jgi:hypothetical protein
MKPYDPKLFNDLYKRTERLRHSLVYGIDHSRFGVTRDEVMSWMDDKFIFVFNKYQDQKSPDVLLGFIINSLKMFKMKILRRSYQDNNSVNLNSVCLDDLKLNYIKDEVGEDNYEILLGLALSFMQDTLSREAYELLQIQLTPPLYITSRLKSPSSKIPLNLILEYLGLDPNGANMTIIRDLQYEIGDAMRLAQEHFRTVTI